VVSRPPTCPRRYGRSRNPRVLSLELDPAPALSALAKADPDFAISITIVEGDVRDPATAHAIERLVPRDARCMVVEDSAHTFETTRAALTYYAPFVDVGGFFVVEDGCVDIEAMRVSDDWPRGVLPALHSWLEGPGGAGFRVRRDLEVYGISCHPEGFLQRVAWRSIDGAPRLGVLAAGELPGCRVAAMRASQGQVTSVAKSAQVRGWRSVAMPAESRGWLTVSIVVILTALGAALRLTVGDQSLFADELASYWIVSTNGLGGVVSTVHSDAEITPPLFFIAAWLTTQIDLTPELLRAPSLLAGTATIPLTYLLGLQTVGRAAGLVAAALTTLSPFMIYYSAEARGYALAVALVVVSTLALLTALDQRRARWWLLYGLCTCAAVYTHYTTVFALGAQLLWLIWAHPEARRTALLANAGAIVAFLPWLPGLIADFGSPTTDILDSLSPFDWHAVRVSLEHWALGHPLVFSPRAPLRYLPGVAALMLLGIGVAVALVGVARADFRSHSRFRLAGVNRPLVLILALALATPVGEALVSAVGTNLLTTRNVAVSWPGFAVALAALVVAAGPRLRFLAAGLVIACFAIAAAKAMEADYERPDYEAAGGLIDREASFGDVVVDAAASLVTPGPYSGLDLELERPHRIFRVGVPQQRNHPFRVGDPVLPTREVVRRAATAAGGGRIFIATADAPITASARPRIPYVEPVVRELPPRYQRVGTRIYPGSLRLAVLVYADRRAPQR
jgi:4-amino-4-deoxy-L-arabinose transferase-like glycosyltransferase